MSYTTARGRSSNGESNRLYLEDRPVHEWYRFVLSFPPHLVRDYLQRFAVRPGQHVLDPFCGTGTTLVESKKLGFEPVGIEANPMAHFAASIKLDWRPDPDDLLSYARTVAEEALCELRREGIEDEPALLNGHQPNMPSAGSLLPAERSELLLADSISPLPLRKSLVLLSALERQSDKRFFDHARLAFAKSVVTFSSNLHFGPEVGVTTPKADAAVIGPWLQCVGGMADDLRGLPRDEDVPKVHLADARELNDIVGRRSIDVVITSPPYPNEKDYTRTTRLESVLLGFVRNKHELRAFKKGLVRSNTRSVYKEDDDDQWVAGHAEIQRIAHAIEARRIELKKTSGFERLYARLTKLYFGGMHRHLASLQPLLRPGAQLAYVVGDQASYLRVMIRTGQLLAGIAADLGYEVIGVDLFRTRLATATREQLNEEVVVLRWPG